MTGGQYVPFNQVSRSIFVDLAESYSEGLIHISGDGPYTKMCESLLQTSLGCAEALLTTSCTSALEMSALLLDASQSSEVIVPAFTFVSTANAFFLNGLRPRFADVDPLTLNVTAETIRPLINSRTRAVCVVHYAGIACDLEPIVKLCRDNGLTLIEDNAHGLFGTYRGRALGSIGELATLSFHETKNFTSGEGGALLLNDPAFLDRAHILREKGTNRRKFKDGLVDKYTWVDKGSSWVMSDLLARLLLPQLENREVITERRRRIFDRYWAGLAEWAESHQVQLPTVPDYAFHPGHLFYMVFRSAQARTDFISYASQLGVNTVFHYQALNSSPVAMRMGEPFDSCPTTESISERLVRLPMYADLTDDLVDRVLEVVRGFDSHR